MTVIKLISFVIFLVACVTIYHNTNSFEPKKRFICIGVRNDFDVFPNKLYMLY